METEPQPPTRPSLLGGVLTLTIVFVLFGGLAWLAGVPWIYPLAVVVGGLPLSLSLMVYAARRVPPRTGNPPPALGPHIINLFSGRFGAVAFWFVGVCLVIPAFASVVSSIGQYVVAPLAAAALASWLPPARTATVVGLSFYLTSVVLGFLFWHWSWQQLKSMNGAA